MAEFGPRLKGLREDKGLTPTALASHAGVTPGYIHQLERGARGDRLAAPVALRIARALGVTVEELLEPADVPVCDLVPDTTPAGTPDATPATEVA